MSKQSGIYLIRNLVNNKVYIGQSIDLRKRISEGHVYKLKRGKSHNIHLQRAWEKYGDINFKIEILEYCEREILDERENYWMDFYKSYNKEYGYNICKKARGPGMFSHSDEARSKISRAMRENNPFRGRKHTEETKEIFRQKKSIAVAQISLDGEFVKKWDSAKQASEYIGCQQSQIRACLYKKTTTAYGYIWVFYDEYTVGNFDIEAHLKNDKWRKGVLQYSKDGTFIRKWRSAKEAQEALSINNIGLCCRGGQKSAGGFVWKFEDEVSNCA